MIDFACVVAADLDNGIGKDNGLPWPRLKLDLKHFKDTTCRAAAGKRNAILMGRKTWESVPEKQRPLVGRWNVVISRGEVALAGDAVVARSLDDALAAAATAGVERCFVIGGAQIYRQAFAHPRCRSVYLTRIQGRFDCDAHIPALGGDFVLAETIEPEVHEAGLVYSIARWDRV